MRCPGCKKHQVRKNGHQHGKQRYQCLHPACEVNWFVANPCRAKYPTEAAAYMRNYRARKKKATQQHLKAYHRHKRDDWETPAGVFDPLAQEFGCTLDVCAT